METPRLLFVHAHPDDETIMTGGTIARYLDAGVDSVITDRPDLLRGALIARDEWLPLGAA